jgi:hypothetical protein
LFLGRCRALKPESILAIQIYHLFWSIHSLTHTHTYIYIYIDIYMYVVLWICQGSISAICQVHHPHKSNLKYLTLSYMVLLIDYKFLSKDVLKLNSCLTRLHDVCTYIITSLPCGGPDQHQATIFFFLMGFFAIYTTTTFFFWFNWTWSVFFGSFWKTPKLFMVLKVT